MWCCWTSPGHNPASTRSAGRPLALSSIQAMTRVALELEHEHVACVAATRKGLSCFLPPASHLRGWECGRDCAVRSRAKKQKGRRDRGSAPPVPRPARREEHGRRCQI